MEWLITHCLCMETSGIYVIIVQADNIRLIATVSFATTLLPGDILYPARDARYLVNREKDRIVKVLRSVKYTVSDWRQVKNTLH
ncbi:hypothetical protein [Pectobacterium versatile]|uniref:hypothetical protein n=1 Tax=Pectobacterium versatile TaxID=2488639 RepID=UPI00380BEEAE